MAQRQRIVAELGRPETPEETAARKAAASRTYRAAQNVRGLIAAIIATLVVVAIVIFAVPRGTPPEREPIDVAAAAERVASSEGGTVIAPETPDGWIVNRAVIEGVSSVRTWMVVLAPAGEDERGFLRVAQGFDADPGWVSRVLAGAAPEGTVDIDGVEWERYSPHPERAGNVSTALATTAGDDTILVYGAGNAATLETVAAGLSDSIRQLDQETTP